MTKEQPGDIPTNGDGTPYSQTEVGQANPTVINNSGSSSDIYVIYNGIVNDFYRTSNTLPLCQGNPLTLSGTY